jgi:hypothetical protein
MHKAGAVQVMVTDAGITVRTGWITESEIAAAVTGAVIARRRKQRKNAGNHFIHNPWIISI